MCVRQKSDVVWTFRKKRTIKDMAIFSSVSPTLVLPWATVNNLFGPHMDYITIGNIPFVHLPEDDFKPRYKWDLGNYSLSLRR